VVRPPAWCELCRQDKLGPGSQPHLNAVARVYTPGNPQFDLCRPHLEVVASAYGADLNLLELFEVPPGAPGPVRRAFARRG
jgi:hypothetical protein